VQSWAVNAIKFKISIVRSPCKDDGWDTSPYCMKKKKRDLRTCFFPLHGTRHVQNNSIFTIIIKLTVSHLVKGNLLIARD